MGMFNRTCEGSDRSKQKRLPRKFLGRRERERKKDKAGKTMLPKEEQECQSQVALKLPRISCFPQPNYQVGSTLARQIQLRVQSIIKARLDG